MKDLDPIMCPSCGLFPLPTLVAHGSIHSRRFHLLALLFLLSFADVPDRATATAFFGVPFLPPPNARRTQLDKTQNTTRTGKNKMRKGSRTTPSTRRSAVRACHGGELDAAEADGSRDREGEGGR